MTTYPVLILLLLVWLKRLQQAAIASACCNNCVTRVLSCQGFLDEFPGLLEDLHAALMVSLQLGNFRLELGFPLAFCLSCLLLQGLDLCIRLFLAGIDFRLDSILSGLQLGLGRHYLLLEIGLSLFGRLFVFSLQRVKIGA